jgi:ATP-dependent Clp protease protease subunit
MPLAERVPETDWNQWMRATLFERRTVLLAGELDDEAANRASVELMTLDATGDSAIALHIDSGGGTVAAALAVIDVIDLLGVPVRAFGTGKVGGPAVGVLAVCSHRAVARHASIRLFEPPVEAEGNARQLTQMAAVHTERWDTFCRRMAEACRRDPAEVRADCSAGRFLTAEEAVAYGLADEIASPQAQVHRLPGNPMGFGPR